MRLAPLVLSSIALCAALAACIDAPLPEAPPSARIVVTWDPLACGTPHRVAIELADEDGAAIAASAPCALGGLTLEAPHFGVYYGRIYAWSADRPIRSITPVRLHVDEPIVRWIVPTPV